MAVSREEKLRVKALDLPSAVETRRAILAYQAQAGYGHHAFAERIGYSHVALDHFMAGTYARQAATDIYLRAAAWDYMNRCPLQPVLRVPGNLFETENVRRIRQYFDAAVEHGEVCLLYGPPGTQKTFTLLHLIAERNRANAQLTGAAQVPGEGSLGRKKSSRQIDAIYVYASVGMSPASLLQRVGREAGIHHRSVRERILASFISYCRAQEHPPAVIIDEAQHLTKDGLEQARELNDQAGCGLILAGSHNLYEEILKNRRWLEQWISRQDHKEPLPGLLENEVAAIAARELGNGHPAKLSDKQVRALTEGCRVDDFYSRNAEGQPEPRKYYSVRRLTKMLAQYKSAQQKKGAAA